MTDLSLRDLIILEIADAECGCTHGDAGDGAYVKNADAVSDAILELLKGAVKPLEWENVSGKVYDADGMGVLYRIVGNANGTKWAVRVGQTKFDNFDFPTFAAASEFCRGNVIERILAALGVK